MGRVHKIYIINS